MVTVLMASYNGEKYLKEQLDSILDQTFPDIRIVVSDDGSTDQTLNILKQYKKNAPDRVFCLSDTGNFGSPQNNFFHLLQNVSDEYLMLSDQDDIWEPEKVELMRNEMKHQEYLVGRDTPILIHSDLSIMDQSGEIKHQSMAKYQKIPTKVRTLSHYLVENNITGNTIMINQAFQTFFSYIPETCMMHDWWMGLLGCCFGRIVYLDRPLVRYRQHETNQLGSKSGFIQCLSRFENKEKVRENYSRMFRQAELFYTQYSKNLTDEQRELIQGFLSLRQQNRLGKIVTILKYKFFKSTPIRTLGQMFFI